jgi:hypothetical protein
LKPGRPVEFPEGALPVAIGVEEETGAVDSLFSGMYENAGMLRVPLIGPLSTAATELAGATGVPLLNDVLTLLDEGSTTWLVDGELEVTTMELAMADDTGAGAGVGVKYAVDSTVSASCVATGSPLGLRKVMAEMMCVITVFCIGSITSAVSALTSWPALRAELGVETTFMVDDVVDVVLA